MTDVLVVGAGVVGASAALRLRQAGAAVTLVDGGAAGAGTSAASFSMDITSRKTPRALFDLAREARAAHRRLAAVLEDDGWLHAAAILEWATTSHDQAVQDGRLQRLQDWGEQIEVLRGGDVDAIDSTVQVPARARVLHYPVGAWYDVPLLIRLLVAASRRLGVRVIEGDAIVAIDRYTAGGWRARRASGQYEIAGTIVNAGGPAAADVASLAGGRVPMHSVPGLIVTTEPIATPPRTILTPTAINVRAQADGGLRLHSYDVDRDLSQASRNDVTDLARSLVRRAAAVLVLAAEPRVRTATIGVRPIPADGLPAVGPDRDIEALYHVVTHSGAHLAPLLGQLVALDVSDGPLPVLEPFRPRRLLDQPVNTALDESQREMARRLAEHDSPAAR